MDEKTLFLKIESILAKYPVCQYGFLKSEEITFTDRVRQICQNECPRYGSSWSCPPGTGTVEECQKRCTSYHYALVFTTLAEVEHFDDLQETLATRFAHEKIVKALRGQIEALGEACFALSSESCALCPSCAYPRPCRHPDYMLPCIESQGILVTEAAEKCGIEYFYDSHTVTWYGILFFCRVDMHSDSLRSSGEVQE